MEGKALTFLIDSDIIKVFPLPNHLCTMFLEDGICSFKISPELWRLGSSNERHAPVSVMWSATNHSKNDPTEMHGHLDINFFFSFGNLERLDEVTIFFSSFLYSLLLP